MRATASEWRLIFLQYLSGWKLLASLEGSATMASIRCKDIVIRRTVYWIILFPDHIRARGNLPSQGTNVGGSAGRGFDCEDLHSGTLYIALLLMLVFNWSGSPHPLVNWGTWLLFNISPLSHHWSQSLQFSYIRPLQPFLTSPRITRAGGLPPSPSQSCRSPSH